MTAPDLGLLQDRLAYRFVQPGLLEEALVHASAAGRGNERLEFLGDRVLGLLVAERLFERFPQEPEGGLGRRFAELVSRPVLAEVARGLELGRWLDTGEGDGVLADTMEAVIAAVYRDGGLEAARRLVLAHWAERIEAARTPPREPKTTLQEWAAAEGLEPPTYRVVSQAGPPHDPQWTIELRVGAHAASGFGRSKRAAEKAAAAIVLAEIEAGHERK